MPMDNKFEIGTNVCAGKKCQTMSCIVKFRNERQRTLYTIFEYDDRPQKNNTNETESVCMQYLYAII